MELCIDYQERAAFLKALAHPVRLQIVHSLLTMGYRNVGCIEKAPACPSRAFPSICRDCGQQAR